MGRIGVYHFVYVGLVFVIFITCILMYFHDVYIYWYITLSKVLWEAVLKNDNFHLGSFHYWESEHSFDNLINF